MLILPLYASGNKAQATKAVKQACLDTCAVCVQEIQAHLVESKLTDFMTVGFFLVLICACGLGFILNEAENCHNNYMVLCVCVC